jgi:hypothetical protein
MVGGTTRTVGSVLLSGAAPADLLVNLGSDNNAIVSVPQTVMVPAGATQAAFEITASIVPAPTTVLIFATYNGVARYAPVTVEPLGVKKVSLIPASTTGGVATRFNTVMLNGTAPTGGIVVTLTSSNPSIAQTPASVTIPAGASTTGYFVIATTSVANTTQVTITATYNGVSRTAVLTINP